MLWACILLPQLALDAVLRQRDDPQQPLVLVTGPVQRRVLQAVNPAARALGLKPGQSLTAAYMLSRDFATAPYDPAQIEHWQGFLAAWAYRFSSQVSVHYPRVLLLEVQSTMGLFGPWPQFEARLRDELNALGFRHRITLAPNPAAARMLANAYDGFGVEDPAALVDALQRLPVERVGLAADDATALKRMGMRYLGEVLSLPRAQLARRFPAQVLSHLDTLLGHRPLALEFFIPADVFDQRIELNFDVESNQALLFPLRRLINDLAAYLAGRDVGVQRFTLHLKHADGEDTRVEVGLLAAERDAALLFELARGRFEHLQVPRPVQVVRLSALDLPRFVPACKELFDQRPQQTQPWEQLRERLRARLGDDALQDLRAHADHRPERAWRNDGPWMPTSLDLSAQRPGWLLEQAEPLPAHGLRVLAGPERIESGWWDGGDVRRDYYLVETSTGRRGWAYRSVGDDTALLLQGWFA